jgi:hypothetical protein
MVEEEIIKMLIPIAIGGILNDSSMKTGSLLRKRRGFFYSECGSFRLVRAPFPIEASG